MVSHVRESEAHSQGSEPRNCSLFLNSEHGTGLLSPKSLRFPSGSVVKNLSAKMQETGLIPGLGRSPGEGKDYPLQYSHLGNPIDRGAWWAAVWWAAKKQT